MKTYDFKTITKIYFGGGSTEDEKSLFSKINEGVKNPQKIESHPKEQERLERINKRRGRKLRAHKDYTPMGNGRYNDSVIVVSGGYGLGTKDDSHFEELLSNLNKLLSENNAYVVFVRGSNDDPSYFGGNKFNFSNIVFAEDYSVLEMNGYNCLCIGGSLPIDRKWRQEQEKRIGRKLFFEKCTTDFNEDKLDEILKEKGIACVITCDAPTFVPPLAEEDGNSEWVASDNTILSDIIDQRLNIDRVYHSLIHNKNKPILWCFASELDTVNTIGGIKYITSSNVHIMYDLNNSARDITGFGLSGKEYEDDTMKKKISVSKKISRYSNRCEIEPQPVIHYQMPIVDYQSPVADNNNTLYGVDAGAPLEEPDGVVERVGTRQEPVTITTQMLNDWRAELQEAQPQIDHFDYEAFARRFREVSQTDLTTVANGTNAVASLDDMFTRV